MCSVHIPAYGVQFLVSNMQKNILKYVSFKLAAFQRMTHLRRDTKVTYLDAVKSVHERLRNHSLTTSPTKSEIGFGKIKLLCRSGGNCTIKRQYDKVSRMLDTVNHCL